MQVMWTAHLATKKKEIEVIFYKELKKYEEETCCYLEEQIKKDCQKCIAKLLAGENTFQSYLDVSIGKTTDEYERPFVILHDLVDVSITKHTVVFVKLTDSVVFDDETISSLNNETDIVHSLLVKGKKKYFNADTIFTWLVVNNFQGINELKLYVENLSSEGINARIITWEDLFDNHAKFKSELKCEVYPDFIPDQNFNKSVHFFMNYYCSIEKNKELIITNYYSNVYTCNLLRDKNNQSLLDLQIINTKNLDETVRNSLDKKIDEVTKAEKILLVVDDDKEGKALKDSIIKYFKNEFPEIIAEQRLECITFPEYFVEPNEISDGDEANSIQELEKIFNEWNEDLSGKSFTVKKGISSLEDMGYYSEFYLDAVINYQKHRKIIE